MKKLKEQIVYQGKWLSVLESHYENKKGEAIIWESILRSRSTVGVVAFAKLKPSNRFILIKQFRPAINGYVIGLPAGLSFDDPQQALNELKEETGYTGKIVSVSPILKTGSTITNESGRIICIEVDERKKENKHPVQHLEPGEDITVHLVSKSSALRFLKKEMKMGTQVSSNLWYLFGIQRWFST